ncbi:MAG TPA: ATP-binding protein [Thermoanaerobaculia bacterium]|nr:ATP-binding protein [Thermoanaerobaculia bacterium]
MTPLVNQLRWYTAIRVVAIVSVLLPYFLLQIGTSPAEAELVPRFVLAVLAGATFAATLVYIALMRVLRRHPTAQAYIQFIGDLILITVLVYFLGGATSSFSLLYLIVIAVASTLLRRRAGVTVASIAFLLYGGLVLFLYSGKLKPFTPQEPVTAVRLWYTLAVHGFGFYAVALLTYYLAHNVTRVELALEEKSEHLADLQVVHRDVIQSITSGIVTTDLAGVVTSANHAGLEILGREEAETVGRPVQESGLFTALQWSEATAASEQTGRMRSEVEVVRGSDTRYVGFSVSRLTDGEENHRGYIIIFQDLTRWRRMQEELRIKDRMVAVGELAAGLAHEIGNPLAAISGSVQMLSSSVEGDAAQRKLIEILLKESHRLDRTIKGFLRFARPRERSSVSFDVARLLAENVELLKNSEEVSDLHQLEVYLDPPSARVFADPDQVSQIFWNLARNALRAMPDGGILRVTGELQDEWYRLQVIDTGRGMSEEQRTNLFHPFQSFFDGGTGIGMAIVYRIVQDHGGRLRVVSRPGAGTTITVELPTADSSVTLVSAEAPA